MAGLLLACRGSFTVNVVPSASVERTVTVPPWAWAICSTMKSPSPSPEVGSLLSMVAYRKGSKTCGSWSGGMGAPVLWTSRHTVSHAAVERVRRLGARVIEEPHVNPAPQHREIWLEDLDGYVVVLASPDGEAS